MPRKRTEIKGELLRHLSPQELGLPSKTAVSSSRGCSTIQRTSSESDAEGFPTSLPAFGRSGPFSQKLSSLNNHNNEKIRTDFPRTAISHGSPRTTLPDEAEPSTLAPETDYFYPQPTPAFSGTM